ncbi:hypothetical protein X474_03800 [Dethiosulfatarculus sandiegensis]|uniref:Uncharacterized protein n=1 Tax=Dethiosulfatarculus sandiegensis TaxID=1429043 RepID=A0A0D2HYQ6_9BACT|nr:hypothetical protein X474_03800 [Dethiosulfatarculus sandiegensis]
MKIIDACLAVLRPFKTISIMRPLKQHTWV